jgi:hypothetical protein
MTIPDPSMRRHALEALRDKRPLLDGAALFWILPAKRHRDLVKLLVAFQILANFHDHAGERAAGRVGGKAAGSIRTLGAVVDLEAPWDGYFDDEKPVDGGYLDALAQTCRAVSGQLPLYAAARGALIEQTSRARVMDIEHVPGRDRPERLKRFALTQLAVPGDQEWWEVAAGAASLMAALVAIALAADEQASAEEIERAVRAYSWVGTVGSLLDNYIDQADDAATGAHNYMSYYPTRDAAEERLGVLIERAHREAGDLPRGERHLVIVSSMTAMYLTSDSAQSETLRPSTINLLERGGALTRILVPILSAWRVACGERDA